jgi:O-antigen biosynthesis protein
MNVLIANRYYPESDKSSGDMRLAEIVNLLLQSGHRVFFLSGEERNLKYKEKLASLGVTCFSNNRYNIHENEKIIRHITARYRFDVAILSYHSVYDAYAPFIKRQCPGCRLILDTVDLHFLREGREICILKEGRKIDVISAVKEKIKHIKKSQYELRALSNADSIWVVTQSEKELLLSMGFGDKPIWVVPNVHNVDVQCKNYSQREGVIFLGSYNHKPNIDAVRYFIKQIYPVLKEKLSGIQITLAGDNPPKEIQEYASKHSNVAVPGFIEDIREILRSQRVAIAPLRYGAGMKGKIGEYMCCGLPCVTTSIGAEGMSLHNQIHVLIEDDPDRFAKSVVELYNNKLLWEKLSENGIEYIKGNLSSDLVGKKIDKALSEKKLVNRSQIKNRAAVYYALIVYVLREFFFGKIRWNSILRRISDKNVSNRN